MKKVFFLVFLTIFSNIYFLESSDLTMQRADDAVHTFVAKTIKIPVNNIVVYATENEIAAYIINTTTETADYFKIHTDIAKLITSGSDKPYVKADAYKTLT